MKIVIAGAGIGGLTAALSFHAAGFSNILLIEAARQIQQVGVGINLPPHAVRELEELGLGDALKEIGIPTAELAYYDNEGKFIFSEARGKEAGYRWQQYSVHRGKLQQILLDATIARLGKSCIVTGQRVTQIEQFADYAKVHAVDVIDGSITQYEAELVVGADGIRSAVRDFLYGEQVTLCTNGWTMFRGTTEAAPFLSGRSMVIVGDEHVRCVVYPIGPRTINWLVVCPNPDTDVKKHGLGNWNRSVAPSAVVDYVKDWRFEWLDIPALVLASDGAYEYPMADIDPLPRWTFDRTTLLGDAAHAMYPFGSNGASQAILDARILAFEIANHTDVRSGLKAYEEQRKSAVGAVQLANRRQAGDVMSRVSEMARAQNHRAAAAELEKIEQSYKKLAGFDVEGLNSRPSWSASRK